MSLAERKHRDAVKVLLSLEGGGYQARLAGGCVRDRLLGIQPADYDVATTARPEEVIKHFAAAGLRTVPTGLAHGTITVLAPAGPVEVTTLRTDVATDGRHAEVAFGESFEADAARRDFTINALFEDARGLVYDYAGGQADLAARTLRFVGDAAARIQEDYLRIMRLYRFWARFGFPPAAGTAEAVAAHADGLRRISQERITSELLRLLAGEHVHAALAGLLAAGVWPLILPGVPLSAASLPPADTLRAWQAAAAPVRGLAVLGGLLLGSWADLRPAPSPDPSPRLSRESITELGRRLKLANAETQALAYLPVALARLAGPALSETAAALDFVDAAEAAGGNDALERFYAPVFSVFPSLLANLTEVRNAERKYGHRRKAKLPLDGMQVAKHLGLAPGPELGAALARLKAGYRNGLWQTAEEGLAWIARRTTPAGS